jgi:uncharacterized membrane protein
MLEKLVKVQSYHIWKNLWQRKEERSEGKER